MENEYSISPAGEKFPIPTSQESKEEFETMKVVALAGHLSDAECTALLQKGFDDYVVDIPQDTLIEQPWDMGVVFVPPISGR